MGDRLVADVQLLGALLGLVAVKAGAGEAPDDDDAGESLDRRVEPEADQSDRAGDDPGDYGDAAFEPHPDEADPGEDSGLAGGSQPFWARLRRRGSGDGPGQDRQRGLAHRREPSREAARACSTIVRPRPVRA